MKLTNKIIKLLLDLNTMEAADNKPLLIGDGLFLRKNLLALYLRTDKPESHDLIIQIMAEGGYPWFGKIAKVACESVITEEVALADAELGFVMSEDDFLELLPANGHFH